MIEVIAALVLQDPVIGKLEAARRYLIEATDLSEVKGIMDVAASAEVYARRQQLGEEAISYAHRVKTEALARLGELLRDMPKAKGAAGIGLSKSAVPEEYRTEPPTLAELGISKKVSSMAQQLAALSPELRERVAKRETTIAKLHPHVSRNTGENEWYTPPEYIEAAREFMGAIDLDPATSEIANRTVGAAQIFTEEENGLLHPWHGRIWMNPPYAPELVRQFAGKLCQHLDAEDVSHAAVLVNNATETRWFQDMAHRAHSICFPLKRVRFLDPEGNPGAPLQGQAVLGIGGDAGDFLYAFRSFGLCVRVHQAIEEPPDE